MFGGEERLELKPFPLGEICAYCFLTRMSERRIAEVVGETCRRHDFADVVKPVRPRLGGIARKEL